ncbi:Fe-S cluster assembly sulfur transfer protein SufU [Lactobacillus corticis]|uniref:Nitrogen fixation protein NifU n=1 Tax=Lactobacillus corticis TaxID=2201249 RepID=A0A916QJY9_9LACO|nr:SUF system NifU family Fe-S cluster assembly protein [Lactobacillus corticis]GFZ26740.1 nitrogen fixation protein NifU [Lactobacillus corticis]
MSLADMRSLYQAVVLDHAAHPRHKGELSDYNAASTVHNPSCGDTIKLFLQIDQDKITAASFTGSGCTISQASASLLTEAVIGKTTAQCLAMAKAFSNLATGQEADQKSIALLGDSAIMTTVMQFPARIKCATISWWALDEAIIKMKGHPND